MDKEFAHESRALMAMAVEGKIMLLISDLLLEELEDAPSAVVAVLESVPMKNLERLSIGDDAHNLSRCYLEADVVGPASEEDALHVAIATVSTADLIVSWNFKHIVHVDKIRRFNAVNLREGYGPIDIRSPKEVV